MDELYDIQDRGAEFAKVDSAKRAITLGQEKMNEFRDREIVVSYLWQYMKLYSMRVGAVNRLTDRSHLLSVSLPARASIPCQHSCEASSSPPYETTSYRIGRLCVKRDTNLGALARTYL